ncbi:glycosyltransferase family 4 protein [Haloferula sp. A504]|uniref:glycosyltransferase family 4 protein n=1 Tax=Haloferula sp. A504 TaxID=3373601 RepID=UPI0031BCF50A|nr:glycosyltransferase [Verrucomicrobiaceae bacterium E54]
MPDRTSGLPLVVFAQVPPPEHGQSRMVALGLEALRNAPERFDVHHIDARFSDHLDEIGEGSLRKLWRGAGYVVRAVHLRMGLKRPVLYYVPGPVKWSAVIRDWLVLGVLRISYRTVCFHWHAIGQGEWATGSERVRLPGPVWLDRIARTISRIVLWRPEKSLVVCETSRRDADALSSREVHVVPNGVDAPAGLRIRPAEAGDSLHLLFLGHGTRAKGLLDLLEALEGLAKEGQFEESTELRLSLAGGISPTIREACDEAFESLRGVWGDRLRIKEHGFLDSRQKWELYQSADLFVAPSRWESFGLTVVEAMATGLPIVAAGSDGVTGILGEDYDFLVPVGEPERLAGALGEALAKLRKGELSDLGHQLRARYEENFRLTHFRSAFVEALGSEARAVEARPLRLLAYLADQNPMLGRSLGISRMTDVVLGAVGEREDVELGVVVSGSSVQGPANASSVTRLPWSTKSHLMRVVTDNLHPILGSPSRRPDVWYFPKGFMPRLRGRCRPAVVTIHDTIIQYYQDNYPKWRLEAEYTYWAAMLRNTLSHAAAIMTVSENAKGQILDFMRRHGLPEKEIHVTYEPCLYESLPQPEAPAKADYVLHLGSLEPHKRTSWLVKLWAEAVRSGREVPQLHVVGKLPTEVEKLVGEVREIVYLPFLEDRALVSQFTAARALMFPSEVEGFGLPAIEAYYLGTPVCYTLGTSIEEVLAPADGKGGFDLEDPASLWSALDEVLAMTPEEVRDCGLALREKYSSRQVVERMMEVFERVARDR